jgi:hypothetical protein
MALPALVAVGAADGKAGDITPELPAGLAEGDLMVLNLLIAATARAPGRTLITADARSQSLAITGSTVKPPAARSPMKRTSASAPSRRLVHVRRHHPGGEGAQRTGSPVVTRQVRAFVAGQPPGTSRGTVDDQSLLLHPGEGSDPGPDRQAEPIPGSLEPDAGGVAHRKEGRP